MQKLIALLMSMSLQIVVFAQVSVNGVVKNEENKPLPNASIIISPVNSTRVLAYKMTDNKGTYTVSFQTEADSVQVKMNLMNYEPQVKIITNKTQLLDFSAIVKPTVLDEVFVKDPMMMRKGDTITHDVNQFANKNDRTLSDVIKRMPGLEIDEGGKIKYQGKDINQFMVEGKDLMQGRYGVIPNAIPFGDVSKLEVIESNQPVRMLKDKIPSEEPGINIRLKKNVTWTGSGSLGVGLSPYLWNVKLTPMVFNKKRQVLFNLKSNNTGEDVIAESGNFINMSGFRGMSRENVTGTFLGMSSVGPPANIKQSRYWYNKSAAASANFLQSLKNDWEVKTNVLYNYQDINLKGSSQATITNLNNDGSVANTLSYSRRSETNNIDRKLGATISLNKNGKNNFFKNDLTFGLSNNDGGASLYIDGVPTYQQIQGNGASIQNSLSTLLPLDRKGKWVANVQSFINYVYDPEWYRVDSLNALTFTNADMKKALAISQNKKSESFNTTNSITMLLSYKAWTITPAIKFMYANELLNTELELIKENNVIQPLGVPWLNDLHLKNTNTQFSTGLNYKKEKFRFTLNLPVNNNIINVDDSKNKFARDLNKWLLQPSMFTEIIIRKLTFMANASKSNSFSSLTSIYPGFTFSALNFNAYNSPIAENQFYIAGTRISYKNLLYNIDANIGTGHNYMQSNIMMSRTIADNGQQITTAILKDNKSSSFNLSGSFAKFFKTLKTSLNLNYRYAQNQAMNLLNGSLFNTKTFNNTAGIRFENSYLDWLIANYGMSYSQSKRLDKGKNNLTYSLNQTAGISIYVLKKGSLNISGDWTNYTIDNQIFRNKFLDMFYRHTVGDKRKVDLELRWTNILNTREYEQVVMNSIQTNITQFRLRPSQVLLNIRMNLR